MNDNNNVNNNNNNSMNNNNLTFCTQAIFVMKFAVIKTTSTYL